MNKIDWSGMVKNIQKSVKKHSPEILTGIGIAGMVTSTVMAVKATPKALVLLDEEKKRKCIKEERGPVKYSEFYDKDKSEKYKDIDLTLVEKLKATWKCYIPASIVGGVSIFCLVGGSSENLKRNAALATAYSLSESALKTYQEKVIEVVGENTEQEVRDAVAKEKIKVNPPAQTNVIITGNGTTRCYDAWSGRYFDSDVNKLKEAENTINEQMREENSVSLNDLYYEIGLESTEMGEYLGWNIDNGYVKFTFSSQLDANNHPCLVIGFTRPPEYEFA